MIPRSELKLIHQRFDLLMKYMYQFNKSLLSESWTIFSEGERVLGWVVVEGWVGRNGWCRSINITAMIHKENIYTPVTAKSNSSKIWFTDKWRNTSPTHGILIRGPGFLFWAIKRLFLQPQKHNGGMKVLEFMNFNGYW